MQRGISRHRAMLALGGAATVLSCSKDAKDPAQTPGVISIGELTSVTGDLAGLGADYTNATLLASEEINAQGGVLGQKVTLLVQDDATTEDGARMGYAKLLSAGVPLVLGPTSSAQVAAIAPLITSSQTLTIGRSTTSAALTGISPNFVRLSPSDVAQATVLAQLVADAHPTNICIVHRNDVYGTPLQAAIAKSLAEKLPGAVISDSGYDPSAADLSTVIPQCLPTLTCVGGADAGAPDAAACARPPDDAVAIVFVTFVSDGAALLDDAIARGFSATKNHFFFSDGLRDPNLLTLMTHPGGLEKALGTSASGPDPASAGGRRLGEFKNRYKARYGKSPIVYAEAAYDAAYIAALAMQVAGTTSDRNAIHAALPNVQTGAQVASPQWSQMLDVVRRDGRIDYVGASGDCDFDLNTGDLKPPYSYAVWTVSGCAISCAISDDHFVETNGP